MAEQERSDRIAAIGFDYESQEKQPFGPCNLCGRDSWTIVSHRDRYGYPATTTSCHVCGLTMLNPRMTADAYTQFYDGVYRPLVSAYHGRRIDAETIQEEQRRYAGDLLPILSPYLEKRDGEALLDVGGSTGVVASVLAERFGLRPTVLDPAPEEVAAADRSGIETVTGFIEHWDPGGRSFEVVGMFQTVDHLLDVGAALGKIRQLLADRGVLIMDVVDFRAAYLRNWSVAAATKVDHPYSLTEMTAEVFLARAGFEVARKSYSPDHLHVLYICRPTEPEPEALPGRHLVERHFAEMRYVMNAPGPTP